LFDSTENLLSHSSIGGGIDSSGGKIMRFLNRLLERKTFFSTSIIAFTLSYLAIKQSKKSHGKIPQQKRLMISHAYSLG
jgi:hypothetical protein